MRRIVLTGFMGSGKTTVGRLLAAQLGWAFADLDDQVSAREQATVPEIFARKGEDFFRIAEAAALQDLLTRERMVIALGGGAPETASVQGLLQAADETLVVHLDAPFPVLYERCVVQARDPSATERPLAREETAALERYLRRAERYRSIAHHTADVSAEDPEQVVQSILRALSVEVPAE